MFSFLHTAFLTGWCPNCVHPILNGEEKVDRLHKSITLFLLLIKHNIVTVYTA